MVDDSAEKNDSKNININADTSSSNFETNS